MTDVRLFKQFANLQQLIQLKQYAKEIPQNGLKFVKTGLIQTKVGIIFIGDNNFIKDMNFLKVIEKFDQYGPKDSMKRSYHKDDKINKEITTNRSYSNYNSKSNNMQKQSEERVSTIPISELILDTRKLLKHFYKQQNNSYYDLTYKFLKFEWQKQSRSIQMHLNKLFYLQESMQTKNYTQIQTQILKQWRKNKVLYFIRNNWYAEISKNNYTQRQDFLKEYRIFSQFIAQVAYLFFKPFFSTLQKKSNVSILDKLTQRTSHLLITHTNTWSSLFESTLRPLLYPLLGSCPKTENLKSFPIQQLQVNPLILNPESPLNQLLETTRLLQQFSLEYKLIQKIVLLKQIRLSLENQILCRQKVLIEQGKISGFKVLDKDDFISSIVYCIVKGEISLRRIGLSLIQFKVLLDEGLDGVLSAFGVASYLTDIQAGFEYLKLWYQEERNCRSAENVKPNDIKLTVLTVATSSSEKQISETK